MGRLNGHGLARGRRWLQRRSEKATDAETYPLTMVDGRERGVYVEEVLGPSIGDVDVRGMYVDGRFA